MCGIDEEKPEVSGQRSAVSGRRSMGGQNTSAHFRSANGASHDSLGFQPQET
jgi:hypothetical protein